MIGCSALRRMDRRGSGSGRGRGMLRALPPASSSRTLTLLLLLACAALRACAAPVPAAAGYAPTEPSRLMRGPRVLALLSSDKLKQTHSKFLKGLADAGFQVDARAAKDDGLQLKAYGDWNYDHVVLLAPRASGFGGDVSKAALLDFVDSGGNLLLALSHEASDTVRALAAELGVEVDAKGTRAYDHFSRQAAGGAADATLVATSAWVDSDAILGASRPEGPVLFRGAAQVVPTASELAVVALSGAPTTYSHDPSRAPAEPPALPAGGAAALVTLVQARNNARAAVFGSLDMLADDAFDAAVTVADTGKSYPKSGNRAFCLGVALWTFQRRGVLEWSAPRHRKTATGELNPPLYRVNDDVEFEIDVKELSDGAERPYSAGDLQVSFVMLDPYVRQPLVPDAKGTFKLAFKVPDVYGVFKYAIDYRRLGYSAITLQQVVPVRPFRHDEYERFLLAAYPYYASAAGTMAAFFLLGPVFLYGGKQQQ